MKKFEILDHKADLRLRAFGKNKKQLFENAMIGMEHLLRAEGKRLKSKPKEIKIKSNDLNSLLVDFLSEINYLNEANKEIYDKVKFAKFSDRELEGSLSGCKVKSFGLVIKGVTYHNLEIKQRNKIWQATILFDI